MLPKDDPVLKLTPEPSLSKIKYCAALPKSQLSYHGDQTPTSTSTPKMKAEGAYLPPTHFQPPCQTLNESLLPPFAPLVYLEGCRKKKNSSIPTEFDRSWRSQLSLE
ncbi:hypothetical protein TNCV_2012051 [Trichonephila clavipes]|nr:hypothetical protein TNCV_2012051 [Trichonephila clavipes]